MVSWVFMENYDLEELLNGERSFDEGYDFDNGVYREPDSEDLQIVQADGTRACAGWELRGGFSIIDPMEEESESLNF
mgnify:CR=1 FL=1